MIPATLVRYFATLQLLLAGLSGAPSDAISRQHRRSSPGLPIVVNTWPFTEATDAAWQELRHGGSAVDAVEAGCSACEAAQCDGTVGYGGSPDEGGETTLDAVIMDGATMDCGAVASLRHVRDAISAARLVMERTTHTMLAGLQAAQFAQEMGLQVSDLSTPESARQHRRWRKAHCQPNFWRNVEPDPGRHCGPYRLPSTAASRHRNTAAPAAGDSYPAPGAHDTIAMVVIGSGGSIAAGASTNGAIHKVPGRVGDGAVPGGGAYADAEAGGCGATGDGDVHLRFLPCFHAVEELRRGAAPREAAEAAVKRIARRVKGYIGALVVVDKEGNHGAACHGWTFRYAVRRAGSAAAEVVEVPCS